MKMKRNKLNILKRILMSIRTIYTTVLYICTKSPQDLWPQFNRQYACAKKKIQEISFAFVYIVNSNKRLNEKQKMP